LPGILIPGNAGFFYAQDVQYFARGRRACPALSGTPAAKWLGKRTKARIY
jgi:hypothetical protein